MSYPDRIAAARTWMRAAKKRGSIEVLGGGWWKIDGWSRPVQGFAALAMRLERLGILQRLPDGTVRLTGDSR